MAGNHSKASDVANRFPPEEAEKWALVIGAVILLFGEAELISFSFIGKLDGPAARDSAMRLGFFQRIKLVEKLVKASRWNDMKKKGALKLWAEVEKQRPFRNVIAHNPWVGQIRQGNCVHGILKIHDLRGPPPYHPKLIQLNEIIIVHNSLRQAVFALKAFVKPG
jgi:hypothetical protein